jgi:hypothetical protein
VNFTYSNFFFKIILVGTPIPMSGVSICEIFPQILNHIKWKKSTEFYTIIKEKSILMIRDEYPLRDVIIDDYQRIK